MEEGKSTTIATPVNNAEMIVTSSPNKKTRIEKISDLPKDSVKEILSRVPLKLMRAVRLTCKQWDALSKSRSFSKMHMGKLTEVKEGESTIIVMMDDNLYLTKVVLGDMDEDPIIECEGKLTLLDKQIKISRLLYWDGLLLCVLGEDDVTKYIVWNPYLGHTRWIESHCPHRWNRFTYALGYEDKGSSCRGYKLFRFINKLSCYEIYDFDSGTWKTLDITPHWRIYSELPGVSLKGNTYWPASQSNKEDSLDDHIICFNFTSESFGPLLRLPFDGENNDDVTLSCVREEKLAVLLTRNEEGGIEFETMKYKIWISSKIEAEEVSWTEFLTVETGVYLRSTSNSFFIDEEKKVAMIYYSKTLNIVGEDGYFKRLKLGQRLRQRLHDTDINCSVKVWPYVPSLGLLL